MSIAPPRHSHAHDVGNLEAWMDSVSSDVSQEIGRGARRAELEAAAASGLGASSTSSSLFSGASQTIVDGLYLRARKLTVFNNELARQTAVHCPRVARWVLGLGVRQRTISGWCVRVGAGGGGGGGRVEWVWGA